MGWKDKIKNIQEKVKSVRTKANKIIGTKRMKATKARAKTETKKAENLAIELKKAEKRLAELHSKDAIEKKKADIASLERRLTTKGKVLTGLESAIRTGIKMARAERRRATRPRKPRVRPRKLKARDKG